MNTLAPMENCPGVQGNLYWMPRYSGLSILLHCVISLPEATCCDKHADQIIHAQNMKLYEESDQHVELQPT